MYKVSRIHRPTYTTYKIKQNTRNRFVSTNHNTTNFNPIRNTIAIRTLATKSKKTGRFQELDSFSTAKDELDNFDTDDWEVEEIDDATGNALIETEQKLKKQLEKKKENDPQPKPQIEELVLKSDTISLRDLSRELSVSKSHILNVLGLPQDTKASTQLSRDQIEYVCMDMDVDFKLYSEIFDDPKPFHVLYPNGEPSPDAPPRPPVVTIMGHVDHGKTTLLDALRNTNVAASEAGGITQHIGAFQAQISKEESPVTFIDTPGHAAFSAMRQTGADVTDIVVLVVAADDGVKPQTVEAIKHAQSAGVSIIVAINKIDVPNAKPKRVKEQLLKYNLVASDFGGNLEVVELSALKREGLESLIEVINFQAELLELRADVECQAEAAVIESRVEKGFGITSTVIVKRGILKQDDWIVCGNTYGRVRIIKDYLGNTLEEAPPATPVMLVGLKDLPHAGDYVISVESGDRAKDIVEFREYEQRRKKETRKQQNEEDQEAEREHLNILLKADVQGSIDALRKVLARFPQDKVAITILHEGVGNITESDIEMARTFNGQIFGLNVRANSKESTKAERAGVPIFTTQVIYKVVDKVKKQIEEKFDYIEHEVALGVASVLDQFNVTVKKEVETVLGCNIKSGTISRRHNGVKILRKGKELGRGKIQSLRHFKKDVTEIKSGNECGIVIAFDKDSTIDASDVRSGDTIESFEMKYEKPKFDDIYKDFGN